MNVTALVKRKLDVFALLAKTPATINRRVRGFCENVDPDKLEAELPRIREIRTLIINDADATLRLIAMRPEKDTEYRSVWASSALKLGSEAASIIVNLIGEQDDRIPSQITDEDVEQLRIGEWATAPRPSPDRIPTPLDLSIEDEDEDEAEDEGLGDES
tara:strand:+ start:8150 stop:8626 length:477 start_codon:yes stop_codon:yes gene_type:complete